MEPDPNEVASPPTLSHNAFVATQRRLYGDDSPTQSPCASPDLGATVDLVAGRMDESALSRAHLADSLPVVSSAASVASAVSIEDRRGRLKPLPKLSLDDGQHKFLPFPVPWADRQSPTTLFPLPQVGSMSSYNSSRPSPPHSQSPTRVESPPLTEAQLSSVAHRVQTAPVFVKCDSPENIRSPLRVDVSSVTTDRSEVEPYEVDSKELTEHVRRLQDAARHSRTLVSFRNCEITDDEINQFYQYLDPHLEKLDLSYNRFGTRGCRILGTALESYSYLHNLNLSFTSIGDEGVSSLAPIIKSPKFKTLVLRGVELTARGCENLAHAMVSSLSLELLNISFNKVGDVGANAVAKAVYSMKSIRHLKMESCGIDRAGGMALAAASAHSRSLTHLHLAFNNIDEASAQAFAKMLSFKTCVLQLLDLGNNKLGKDVATLLAVNAKRKGDNSVELRLIGPNLSVQAWQSVKDRVASLQGWH